MLSKPSSSCQQSSYSVGRYGRQEMTSFSKGLQPNVPACKANLPQITAATPSQSQYQTCTSFWSMESFTGL